MGELDEVVPELVELRPVEPELMSELGALRVGQVTTPEQRRRRGSTRRPGRERS